MEDEEIDLFENHDDLPQEVKDVMEKHGATWEDKEPYKACRDLIKDLEKIGYTCEYGLDGVPQGLKKINLEESGK